MEIDEQSDRQNILEIWVDVTFGKRKFVIDLNRAHVPV